MHAADAIHGDLGTIQKEDIIICISKSGETPEIRILVPLLKDFGSSLIAIVGNPRSYLAKQADYILDTTVKKEACPNNLAAHIEYYCTDGNGRCPYSMSA